jgi:DNA-binding MarR family transcriptional regulator
LSVFPPDDGSTSWHYFDLARAHRLAFNALSSKAGLRDFGKPVVLFLLADLSAHKIYPTQRELAEMMLLSPSTVTVSLRSLERQGCIRKIHDDKDLRKNRIAITETGIEVSNRFHKLFHQVNTCMCKGFTSEELELLSSFFARMTANLMNCATQEERSLDTLC